MTAFAPITLVMATYLEAKPFVEKIDWERSANSPFPVYHGPDFSLVISGMGKANAAAACAWICTALAPACIVNLGAAGANREDLPLGGIYHVSETFETDRRHFQTNVPFCQRPDVMPGFPTLRLATRDMPVIDPEERRRIAVIAELADMEGAALIQTARKFQTSCFLFKFVSDLPGHTSGQEIAGLIRRHRDTLFDVFMSRIRKAMHQLPQNSSS